MQLFRIWPFRERAKRVPRSELEQLAHICIAPCDAVEEALAQNRPEIQVDDVVKTTKDWDQKYGLERAFVGVVKEIKPQEDLEEFAENYSALAVGVLENPYVAVVKLPDGKTETINTAWLTHLSPRELKKVPELSR